MKNENQTFFALNRDAKTASLVTGFTCWEHLQGAFHCGIVLGDGSRANGIGKCKSPEDFAKRAKHSGFAIV